MLDIWQKALTILTATGAPPKDVADLAVKLMNAAPAEDAGVVFMDPLDGSIWCARLTGEVNADGYLDGFLAVEISWSEFGYDNFEPVCKTWALLGGDEFNPTFSIDSTNDEIEGDYHDTAAYVYRTNYDHKTCEAIERALAEQRKAQNEAKRRAAKRATEAEAGVAR